MVKYVVRLDPEEREQLLALVSTGRAAAAKLLHRGGGLGATPECRHMPGQLAVHDTRGQD